MTGRVLYGALFVVVLPLALALWAHATAGAVTLPALHSLPIGAALATLGIALWLWSVRELWVRGHGLPMNAYPPQRRVTTGPYAIFTHPIYVGATVMSFGIAVATCSASGLWLVTPVLVLGMVALVAGYERSDLERRLGAPPRPPLVSRMLWAPLATLFRLVGAKAAWGALRAGAEWMANSWHEWRLGPVRIINHGAYAGLAGGVGYAMIAWAAGPQPRWAVAVLTTTALVGAGIWAQLLESSSGLLRPFGYYGSVLGGAVGAALAGSLGAPWPALLAALAVAAPWIQAIGRLRCLVQGCCHGAPAKPNVGIVYRHPRSRVSYLADLAGRPLHPTPLYSILGNVVLGVLLLRVSSLGATTTLTIGIYLIGSGLARFVEEAYRAEPQTAIVGGLHIYQWLAAGSVVAGAIVTCVPGAPMPAAEMPQGTVMGAVLFGLITGAAMGVDAPGSNWRFSRLASGDR